MDAPATGGKMSKTTKIILVVVVLAVVIGVSYWYFKVYAPKKKLMQGTQTQAAGTEAAAS